MKHLTSFNEGIKDQQFLKGGFIALDSTVKTLKQRVKDCAMLAKKNGYKVIQERYDPKNLFKIILILQQENVDYVGFEFDVEKPKWTALCEDLNEMKPLIDPISKKRFVSHADVNRYKIEEWEKSDTLNKLNHKSGIFENNARQAWKSLKVELNPEYAEAYYNRASVLYNKGMFKEAYADVLESANLGYKGEESFFQAIRQAAEKAPK